MRPHLTDVEKLRYLANYLAENVVSYSLNGSAHGTYGELTYPSTYGALIDGKANCSGYADAFAALAYEAGINCIVIDGYANNGVSGERHTWNMVNINNAWYHIDPTWIDSEDGFDEAYFMVSDTQIAKTHTPITYAGEKFIPPPVAD